MIKLIATDLDGTLLTSNGEISERNRQAILAAQKQGIEVIVATGRSFESAIRPFEKAKLVCPMICVNGAEAYQADQKQILAITMSKKMIEEIIAVTSEQGAYLELYTNKGIYAQKQSDFFELLKTLIKMNHPNLSEAEIKKRVNQRFQDESFIFVDDFESLISDPSIEIVKALAFSFDQQRLENIKTTFAEEPELIVTSSGRDNIEFNHPDAQKGLALKAHAEATKIDQTQVMAIGDNDNDLSMLSYAGKSVAMANAKESIKAIADQITSSNDEDGVALVIEEILQ
ncbi:Cof-type HAD-IIB family hydrolase [Amphibacillus indicireducens]|uniref:Cof-type HAD-IIB family hydrolase n=1 Tax=Amphibacillus indicireducens TaxID=1076330 RepID=A0ABP7VAD4_9BACI